MKKALIAAALSLVFAISAFATDGVQPQDVPAQNFDQRKSDILKMLDGRITSLQEARNCIEAATNRGDIRTCREKHRAEMMEMRGKMRHPRGKGGPGGPMGW
jgi:hypothetical protein